MRERDVALGVELEAMAFDVIADVSHGHGLRTVVH